jgi:hypothetical protein
MRISTGLQQVLEDAAQKLRVLDHIAREQIFMSRYALGTTAMCERKIFVRSDLPHEPLTVRTPCQHCDLRTGLKNWR